MKDLNISQDTIDIKIDIKLINYVYMVQSMPS